MFVQFTEVIPRPGWGLWGVSRALWTKHACSHSTTANLTLLPSLGYYSYRKKFHPLRLFSCAG